jgi:LEA14-like dessication related protein
LQATIFYRNLDSKGKPQSEIVKKITIEENNPFPVVLESVYELAIEHKNPIRIGDLVELHTHLYECESVGWRQIK